MPVHVRDRWDAVARTPMLAGVTPFRFALAAALVATFVTAPAVWAGARTPADVLVIAKDIDDTISLDPAEAFEFSSIEVVDNVYDRLVLYDVEDPTRLVGGMAERWSVEGDRWHFHLRPGLTFQSGRPVTADDVVWSLRRVVTLNREPAFILSQLGWNAANAAEMITSPAPDQVVLRIAAPYAPGLILTLLSNSAASILDRAAVEPHAIGNDMGNTWLKSHSAGSGAFVLDAWRPGEFILLTRFEGFRTGPAPMRRIVIRHVKEPASQRLMLAKGDVDVARNLTTDQIAAVEHMPGLTVALNPRMDVYYLGLNQRDPVLSRPQVRRALRWLIDYEGIGNSFGRGRLLPHQAFWPRGFGPSLDAMPFTLDPDRARALLAEAELEGGIELTLEAANSFPASQVAQSIQNTFARAGITLSILPGTERQILTRYRARRHQMVLLHWAADYPDPHTNADAFANNADNSDGASVKSLAWRNAWDIPDLSALTREAAQEWEAEPRTARYLDLQARVQADSAYVVMFQTVDQMAMRDRVSGLVFGPSSLFFRLVRKDAAP